MVNTFILPKSNKLNIFRRYERTVAVTMALKWRDPFGNWHDCDVEMDEQGSPVEYERTERGAVIPQYKITNVSGYHSEFTKLADKADMRWFDAQFHKWAVE